jgi:hypothetical protein
MNGKQNRRTAWRTVELLKENAERIRPLVPVSWIGVELVLSAVRLALLPYWTEVNKAVVGKQLVCRVLCALGSQ